MTLTAYNLVCSRWPRLKRLGVSPAREDPTTEAGPFCVLGDDTMGVSGRHLSEKHRQNLSAALKGRPSYPRTNETRRRLSEANKGHPLSAERRRKISEAKKGCVFSAEHRLRIAEAVKSQWGSEEARRGRSGENASNWRGGVSQDTRENPNGKAWRKHIRARTGGKQCELCGHIFTSYRQRPRGAYAPGAKVAAHLVPYSNGNAPLRTDPANGLLLCGECHKGLDWGSPWYFALCCSLVHWEEAENPRLLADMLSEVAAIKIGRL